MRNSILVFLLALAACSTKSGEISEDADTASTQPANPDSLATNDEDVLNGEYMIGDAVWFITPSGDAGDAFEMYTGPGQEPEMLYLRTIELDTVKVYANEKSEGKRSITIKMYPGHDRGMYYEDDEQWPVHRISEVP